MLNPIFDKKHSKEYLLTGGMAAVAYLVPVMILLYQKRYTDLYLLYIGTALFMTVIFYYNFKLLKRPFEKKRSVSMLLACHLATLAGIFMAMIAIVISFFIFFYPDVFAAVPTDEVSKQAPLGVEDKRPSWLMLKILIVTAVANMAAGSFISVVTSYAGKLKQMKDKTALLETHISPKEV